MSASTITLANVRRSYGGIAVVDDVSLTAPAAQVLALLGPSGSGKSTILRLIAGLEPVDAGEIKLGDETISTPTRTQAPEQRRVGMVFQDYALFPHLTALANVSFGLDIKRANDQSTIDRQALAWLDRVGLAHRAKSYPHELSGGEQQRVALARALAPGPRAVLLDEPFSGLDPLLRSTLRETALAAIKDSGATAVFVTHDSEEALLVADRLAILKAGKLLQEAAPRHAYDHPASLDAAAALGPVNVFQGAVANGRIATPFGDVHAPGLREGDRAHAVVRLEAVQLTPGTQARVIDRRPHGADDLVRIEAGAVVWRALLSPRVQVGERVDVALQAAGVFAFSAA
ncbi:ferric iron ABC transporter ATP-binding protein [alpha proteobacterium U9-1i]|nr:ferric iron ABC transporter ATP-binding protein [alpha proteobacterium U9-1i]